MDKLSIALNCNNQPLSNAGFRKGVENKYWQPLVEFQTQLEKDLVEKKESFEERIKEQEREELERIKKSYEWRNKKAINLSIAYTILLVENPRIDLFTFNKQAFLKVVKENFDYVEIEILADRLYKLYDEVNDKIQDIKSGDNLELYNQYYTYNKDFESISAESNGELSVTYGAYTPTFELIEMENERELYLSLYSEIEKSINYNFDYQYSIKRTKQALALKA